MFKYVLDGFSKISIVIILTDWNKNIPMLNNYRPLALTSLILKVQECVLLNMYGVYMNTSYTSSHMKVNQGLKWPNIPSGTSV